MGFGQILDELKVLRSSGDVLDQFYTHMKLWKGCKCY